MVWGVCLLGFRTLEGDLCKVKPTTEGSPSSAVQGDHSDTSTGLHTTIPAVKERG